jgi:hypothetical protein
MFAVQPEIYYSMKGAKLKDQYNDLNLKLTYVEIPILLQFIVPLKGTPVKPLLFVGPAMGLNLTAKNERTNNGQATEEDFKDLIKSTDLGLVFGGGISLPLGKNQLGIDVRYSLGLSNIGKDTGSATIKNNIINFNLFYGFSF